MRDYLEGILDTNEAAEMYHGIVFSRRLQLRTLHGKTLTIDDPECLSDALKTGTMTRLIVVVSGIDRVRAFTQSRTATGQWSGTIRRLDWEPQAKDYQVYDQNLVESTPMSVVGTANGHVLLPRLLLGGVEKGTAVTWGKDQFRLVAAYN